MPSLTHESVVELLRERPQLALTLWCDLLKHPAPAGARIEDASATVAETRPAEYRADQVLRVLDRDGQLFAAFVVEVQLRPDPEKRFTWPYHLAGVRARLRCPVALLVIALDENAARWCARPIDLGFAQAIVTPAVLGPATIPRLTPEQVRIRPDLAVLSVAAHARTEADAPLAQAALDAVLNLDNPLGTFYADTILAFVNDRAPQLLEQLMAQRSPEYQKKIDRMYLDIGERLGRTQGRAQGRAEGRAKAQRQMLHKFLVDKFGPLSIDNQARIDNAANEQLDRWIDRLFDADTIDAVFADS